MSNETSLLPRRAWLQGLATVAIAAVQIGAPRSVAAESRGIGKPGDFDFLTGRWKISHRKLKNAEASAWDEFSGSATCWSILGGVGSIEELCIPENNPIGMGLRLLDVEKQIWSDYWVSRKIGVLMPAGLTGGFEGGVGTFTADDVDGDTPIKVRGIWDRITPTTCRWRQGASRDGGKTWKDDWFMDWVRV